MATIPGSPGPDTLDGTEFDDTITALAGDDVVSALSGNDLIDLDAGDDRADGGQGDDTVNGGIGHDTLYSGGGNDLLIGGDGNDLIEINDLALGGVGTARAGAGDDHVRIFGSSGGTLQGGTGTDVIEFRATNSQRLTVDLDAGLMTGGSSFFPGVTFISFERLVVTCYGGNDSVLGGALDDHLSVGSGRNSVDAKAGNDRVEYFARDASTLRGGEGEDTLVVGSGSSSLYFIVDGGDGSVDDGSLSDILGFEVFVAYGAAFDDIASLGTGDDAFYGGGGGDTGFGGAGDDSLDGLRGDDSLDGGDGDDLMVSGAGNDTLIGGAGQDRIRGGAGSDSIDAGAGDDRISFFLGNDTVSGGTGADQFIFARNQSGAHTLTDFVSGQDQLHFAGAYLPGSPAPGQLDPALLSFGAASGGAAQAVLSYSAMTDITSLVWDRNGDNPAGGNDLMAQFSGNVMVTVADIFIL